MLSCAMLFRRLLPLLLATLLAACSGVDVRDYSGTKPEFDVEAFFDGRLGAYGVVKNRSGKVIRKFEAEIDASWDNGVGTLVEDFVFDDGEEQRRIWTLTPNDEGDGYIGTANDVVGASPLTQSGSAVFLDYVLRIPYNDGTIDVRVDDRMYLITPDVLINESTMSKFGVEVGQLLLTIVRLPLE